MNVSVCVCSAKQEEQERRDILAQLIKDGLRPDVNQSEQLQHFYRKLCRTEQQLASTLDNMEELRRQQKEEMQAVETYVTHIRQLSEEREQLVSGLEMENAQLKAELQRASSAQQERMLSWQEVKEVLSERELEDIGAGPHSEPKEVIRKLARDRSEMRERCHVAEQKVGVSLSTFILRIACVNNPVQTPCIDKSLSPSLQPLCSISKTLLSIFSIPKRLG